MPGGLFSVLVYIQPLLIGVFAWMWLGERLSPLKLIGLVIGFIGILVVSIDGISGEASMAGVVIGLLTAVSWALGVVYVKKVGNQVDSLWMVAMQFTIGGGVLTAMGLVTEKWSDIVWNAPYTLGLGFGASLGIPIAFVIYFSLIQAGEASKVASFTFLVPLIAVFTGSLFLHEPFTYKLFIGLVLIVASINFVNYQVKPKRDAVKQIAG